MVLAAGGDGTASEVASAFFNGPCNKFPETVFAYLPLGTGCDLARTLFPGSSLQDICKGLSGRRYRDQHKSQTFINIASFGCGGAVARSVTSFDKWFGGKIGFNLAAARTLMRYKDKAVSLSCNGESAERISVTNVAVCNAQYFGGGMWVSPEALVDDGELNVTVWSGFTIRDFLLKQKRLYDGSHVLDLGTKSAKIRSLLAESDEQVFVELDGEFVGHLPAAFEILPSSLKVKIQ